MLWKEEPEATTATPSSRNGASASPMRMCTCGGAPLPAGLSQRSEHPGKGPRGHGMCPGAPSCTAANCAFKFELVQLATLVHNKKHGRDLPPVCLHSQQQAPSLALGSNEDTSDSCTTGIAAWGNASISGMNTPAGGRGGWLVRHVR